MHVRMYACTHAHLENLYIEVGRAHLKKKLAKFLLQMPLQKMPPLFGLGRIGLASYLIQFPFPFLAFVSLGQIILKILHKIWLTPFSDHIN